MLHDGADELAVLDLSSLSPGSPSAVFIREVKILRGPTRASWNVGPLPIRQDGGATKAAALRRPASFPTTDTEARRTLVAERQAAVLYGDAPAQRYHRVVQASPAPHGIVALEVLAVPEGRESDESSVALLAVHVVGDEFDSEAARSHSSIVDGGSGLWDEVMALVDDEFEVKGAARALHFDDLTGGATDALTRGYSRIAGLSGHARDDVVARAKRHQLTLSRPDWSALILRDGGAFIAHQSSEVVFGPSLRNLVHSIYLDALLLAWVQRRLVDRSDRLATNAKLGAASDLVVLEREHFDFKRTYWRTSLTHKRTSPSDEVFRAFQAELLTPRDIEDVESRVLEGARLARTLLAEQAEAAQQHLTRLVRNATIVVGSFSLCFTAAPVLAEPGALPFFVAVIVAIAGMAIAFGVLKFFDRHDNRDRKSWP